MTGVNRNPNGRPDSEEDTIDTPKPSTAHRQVRTSAKAVLFRDGKLLALKLEDADGVFYILPGGGQNAGETLPEACRREVREETGILCEPSQLVFVIEGPHGEPFHRVDLVFRCEFLDMQANDNRQMDKNQIGVEWLDISSLNQTPLYPSRLRRPIMRLYSDLPCAVYLGCESIGDPECVE